jgi:hypothetical protein
MFETITGKSLELDESPLEGGDPLFLLCSDIEARLIAAVDQIDTHDGFYVLNEPLTPEQLQKLKDELDEMATFHREGVDLQDDLSKLEGTAVVIISKKPQSMRPAGLDETADRSTPRNACDYYIAVGNFNTTLTCIPPESDVYAVSLETLFKIPPEIRKLTADAVLGMLNDDSFNDLTGDIGNPDSGYDEDCDD